MKEENTPINKDLILREKLAIERTVMANDRTFLSFIRTSLYFSVAGMTINELVDINYGTIAEVVFWIISILLLIIGVVRYFRQKKKITASRVHIGNYLLDADD